MISSLHDAISLSRTKLWEFSKWQYGIIDNVQSGNVTLSMTLSSQKIIVFDKICYGDEDSSAKSNLSSNFTIIQNGHQMWSQRSWKPKVKPNLVCYSNIPTNMPYISFLVSSWYSKNWWSYKVKVSRSPGNPMTWPLTYDIDKSYFLRSDLVMCNLEMWLWYPYSFPRYWEWRTMHELPWITIFWSQVRWFANHFHEGQSHEWKSLANHLTSDKKKCYSWKRMYYFISYTLFHGLEHTILLQTIIDCPFHHWH